MNGRYIIIAIISIVVIGTIIYIGRRILNRIETQDYLNKNGDLGDAARKNGQKPTHSDVEFSGYAAKIYNAKGYINDDEDAVGAVFTVLHNTLDVTELIRAFGVKGGMGLSEYLSSFLNSGEMETYVNARLRANGINFQF